MCPVPNILLIYTDDHHGAARGPWQDVKAELPVHGRLRRLHRLARASDRPVEELVVSALDESVPRPPSNLPQEIGDELSLLETLSNRDLVEVAQSTLKADEVPCLRETVTARTPRGQMVDPAEMDGYHCIRA